MLKLQQKTILKEIWLTLESAAFAIAVAISWTKLPPKRLELGALFDFRGFLDARYSVLAVGAFFAMLGQYIPYYYISKVQRKYKLISC